MFDDLKVPTISIVENMAYHTCSKCGNPEHIFGPGKIEQIKKQFGIKTSFELPLLTEVSRYCDKGVPPLFAFPQVHDYCQRFFSIAKSFDSELQKVKEEKKDVHFNYETGKQEVVFSHGDKKVVIPAMQLRLRCQCAGCVDELSGKRILNDARVPRDVHPTQMIRKGNYAVAIMWSDGHKSSIYPFESVFAMGSTALAKIEAEDTAVVTLRFKSGALGVIEATTAARPTDLEGSISVLGEGGTVEIGGFAVNKMKVWKFGETEANDDKVMEEYSVNPPNVYGFGHQAYYEHVVDSILNNTKHLVDGLEGRKSLELINAIYESVETSREVHLRFRPKFCRLGVKE